MKSTMIQHIGCALLLMSAPALFCQDKEEKFAKPYVAFGYNFANGHAHDMTQTTWGGLGAFTAEAGFQFQHNQVPVQIRPNIGYAKILGDPVDGVKIYDILGIFLGFDIVYSPVKKLPMSVTVGPSFHSWSVEEVNFPGDPRQGERRIQFGWRMGVGYDVMPNLRVDLQYTIAEWRSSGSLPYGPGWNPSIPEYFTLKAAYTF